MTYQAYGASTVHNLSALRLPTADNAQMDLDIICGISAKKFWEKQILPGKLRIKKGKLSRWKLIQKRSFWGVRWHKKATLFLNVIHLSKWSR